MLYIIPVFNKSSTMAFSNSVSIIFAKTGAKLEPKYQKKQNDNADQKGYEEWF